MAYVLAQRRQNSIFQTSFQKRSRMIIGYPPPFALSVGPWKRGKKALRACFKFEAIIARAPGALARTPKIWNLYLEYPLEIV